MKIAVIIPYHDRDQAYLGDAVESVRRQTRPADEVILIDDGSATPPSCPSWVEVVRMPKNGGPGAARNYGMAHSGADAFAFLDADDVWLPDKLAEQEKALDRADWSYTDCWYLGRRGLARYTNLWFHGFRLVPAAGEVRRLHREGHNFITMSSVMIRRAALDGGFREDLPLSEDWDLFTRLSDAVIPACRPLHLYRLKPLGWHRLHLARYVTVNLDILRRLCGHHPPKAVARIMERAAIQHLNAGLLPEARRLLWSPEITPLAHTRRVQGLRLFAWLPRAAWRRAILWRTGLAL